MKDTGYIKEIVEGIDKLKNEAQKALDEGNKHKFLELMENIDSLKICLVGEIKKELF